MQVSQRIDRALIERQVIALLARLLTCNKAKAVNLLRQLFKGEHQRRKIAINIDQANAGKVADDDIARQLVVGQPMKIVVALGKGRIQVLAARLLLDQQRAGPEHINAPRLVSQLFDIFFKTENPASRQPEDLKKLVPKNLRLGIFTVSVAQTFDEYGRMLADLIEREGWSTKQISLAKS